MGAQLALAAFGFANTADLKPVARILLVFMALRALDADSETGQKARRSFMKRSELGVAIGRMMPDREPGPAASLEERKAWDADDQAVTRALRALKAAGAIREVGSAYTGRTTEFEVCLVNNSHDHTDPPSRNVPHSPTKNEPTGVRFVNRQGDAERTPKEPSMNHEEQEREQPDLTAQPHLQAVTVTEQTITTSDRAPTPDAPRCSHSTLERAAS